MAKKQGGNKPERSAAEIKAEKVDNFKRICPKRVNKALKAIGIVGDCSSGNYVYTEAEGKAVVLALQVAVDNVKVQFAGEAKASGGFVLPK